MANDTTTRTTVTGRRVIAPEFGTSAAGRAWGRVTVAIEADGYAKLLRIFTIDPKSIAELKSLRSGDYLRATGEIKVGSYITKDGREEVFRKIDFATGLRVIPKAKVKPC